MNAHADFQSLKHAIENACVQKNHMVVREVALKLGLEESDISRSPTYALKYIRAEVDGTRITLEFRSFDPSGPFQNLPDVNRFELKRISQGMVVEEFSSAYSD